MTNTRWPARALAFTIAACLAGSAWAQAQATSREQLNALLWQQRAVEYRAAAQQAFRQATARLANVKGNGQTASMEQRHAGGFKNKPPAVVLDIDETVLDNTAYNALLVREQRDFDAAAWQRWVLSAKAAAVPGAPEFIARARSAKFRVVYITNRECNRQGAYDAQGRSQDCPQKKATLDNLQAALGYRPADADVLLRYEQQQRDDTDKQSRRAEVARTHRIALLVGDDLNDFIRRVEYAEDTHGKLWGAATGAAWFALPNPIYGSWERLFPDVAQKYAGLNAWTDPGEPGGAGGGTGSSTGRLRVVSWNLEWLADPQLLQASGFWTQCAAQNFPNLKLRDELPFCDVYKRDGILNPADYEAKKLVPMRARLAELSAQNADVLAVQETGGPGALEAVLPAGWRVACFTTRIDAQNVGYAVREAARLQYECSEFNALSLEGDASVPRPVRRGLQLTLTRPGSAPAARRTLTLLNVHLKSSCPTGRLDSTSNNNCATLRPQVPVLEAWIEEQAAAQLPFLIVGDWNRDLEAEVAGNFAARSDGSDPSGPLPSAAVLRNLWPEINDLKPGASGMELAAVDRSAAAGAGACHDKLDQLAISLLLKAQLDPAALPNGRVPAALLPRPAGASDHCPLSVELQFR